MGVYKRARRSWWITYTVDGKQVFESAHTSNKRLALKLFSIRKAEIAEGRLRLPKSNPPKLAEWAEQFLETIQHPNTRRRYRSSIGNLKAFFGEARLTQVSADRIEQFKQARLKAGAGPATINRDLAVLRRMLKLAARQRLIAQSPFHEVEFLEERNQRRQPHILTFEEQEQLLAVAPSYIRMLVILITETGLRVGREALPLKWEDVDLLNDAIHVRHSKTPAGRRVVPLSSLCRTELMRSRPFGGPELAAYVFPNPANPAMHLKAVRKTWRRALDAAGIPYFPIYNLRATFASRLSAAGVPDVFVAQMLGHSTPTILPTYAKAIDESRRDAIRHLEELRAAKCRARIMAVVEGEDREETRFN